MRPARSRGQQLTTLRRSRGAALGALSLTALALALATGCQRDAPGRATPGRPTSAEPPPDTSGLIAVPLAGGAHELRRVTAELDSVAGGDANLRPDSVDAMLAGTGRSPDPSAGPDPRLPSETGIPVAVGLRLTSVHHYPDGDREKVVS